MVRRTAVLLFCRAQAACAGALSQHGGEHQLRLGAGRSSPAGQNGAWGVPHTAVLGFCAGDLCADAPDPPPGILSRTRRGHHIHTPLSDCSASIPLARQARSRVGHPKISPVWIGRLRFHSRVAVGAVREFSTQRTLPLAASMAARLRPAGVWSSGNFMYAKKVPAGFAGRLSRVICAPGSALPAAFRAASTPVRWAPAERDRARGDRSACFGGAGRRTLSNTMTPPVKPRIIHGTSRQMPAAWWAS